MKLRKALSKVASGLIVAGLVLGVNTSTAFAFDVEQDADNYSKFGETNVYYDETTTVDELTSVINYWTLIPENIKELMFDNGINIYLVGDGSNVKEYNVEVDEDVVTDLSTIDLANDPRDLIPISVENGPAFIEKDPTNLDNLKIVDYNNAKYLLFHGTYIGPLADPDNLDWDYFRQSYLESASLFGQAYLNELMGASDEEADKEVNALSLATSCGPSVEYDADNKYEYCRTVKNGWTEYYSNNTISAPETVIHEIGHHIDWLSVPLSGYYKGTLFGLSDSDEWKQLYGKYTTQLAGIDALSSMNIPLSPSEGFADTFRLYVQRPDELKAVAPEVYTYMEKIVSSYGGYDTFDYEAYADAYPDLKAAFGYDKDSLWQHYKNLGFKEGREVKFSSTVEE